MNTNVVGLDIAKNIFHLYSLGTDGKATKKKLKRTDLLRFFANYTVSLIGIEACGGVHYWARELTKLGHEVVLLNARYVKGFVVGNSNNTLTLAPTVSASQSKTSEDRPTTND